MVTSRESLNIRGEIVNVFGFSEGSYGKIELCARPKITFFQIIFVEKHLRSGCWVFDFFF